MADRPVKYKELPLSGRMVTSVDPLTIGENFQSLTNMRYTASGVKAITGMSKINSTALSSYLKGRSAYHFKKDQPAESHFLAQVYNSGLTASQLLQNTTAIPSAGDFSATALWTDSAGAGQGRFSAAPDGSMAYCNGVDTLVWGGDEHRIASLIAYNPTTAYGASENKFDWTDQVTSAATSDAATFTQTSGGLDANTMLLLHLNNNVTDSSPTTPHTVTNNNVTFSTSTKVLGSHAASFNGTTAWLSIPDDADFNFAAGSWTIDAHVYLNSLATQQPIYYQKDAGTNDMELFVGTAGDLKLEIRTGGSPYVSVATAAAAITTGRWYHIAVSESGNNYYLFIDGILRGYTVDTERAANYTDVVRIGYNTTQYFNGYMDEVRVSNTARYTTDFESFGTEYSTEVAAYMYIGCIRPIKGIKVYVGTANANTGSLAVNYWSGSAWANVSTLVDGTASGGKPFAQTGSITFDDTSLVAKVRAVDQLVLYWYRLMITNPSATTSVYYMTVAEAMQTVKDLWDGEGRTVESCLLFLSEQPAIADKTANIFELDYASADANTYMQIGGLATTENEYIYFGFSERIMGLSFDIAAGYANINAGAVAIISYWNGSTWVSLEPIFDGTKTTGSMMRSGTIMWTPPAASSEFKRDLSSGTPMYYYRMQYASPFLSNDVRIDMVTGIPVQKEVASYKFPLYAQNRLFLCSNQTGDKNSIICSAVNTSSVFNGVATTELYFNDDTELTAGAALYSQFGSSLYNVMILTKEHQTWLLVGSGPEDWRQYQVSETVGCVAPQTMRTSHIDMGKELATANRNIAIWQGDYGIYMSDGRELTPLHLDIADWFDERNSYSINRTKIKDSYAFIDRQLNEYHWLFASGDSTTLNQEFVYSLGKKAWFKIDRGTGKMLQCGCEVASTAGNSYAYGMIDTGYTERLENSTSMDGGAIAHELWLGDLALMNGMVSVESTVRSVGLWTKAKTVTTNNIAVAHYLDGCSTADATITLLPRRSGYRVAGTPETAGLGPGVFHGFKFTMSTTNETYGFEPLFAVIGYKPIREDKD